MERSPRRRRGVSLVEVLICFALLIAALVPFMGTLGGQAKGAETMRGKVLAESLIASTFKTLESMPWNDLKQLREAPQDMEVRNRLRLPPPPEDGTHELRIFFAPVGSMSEDQFQKVTLEVRWKVAGKFPEVPAGGPAEKDRKQVKVSSKLITNRMQTLQDDGVVH